MNILLCGATGFLGRHIEQVLSLRGHTIIRALRTPHSPQDIAVNYVTDTQADVWLPRLRGIDVVINAVGVLRDTPAHTMQAIHADTPKALFTACFTVGIKYIIQMSALGVDGELQTQYMRTKREADVFLQSQPISHCVIRPSLVYGADGESAKMFRLLARLPIVAVPSAGESLIQPVHIDDITQLISILIDNPINWATNSRVMNAVGARSMTFRQMLGSYRAQMQRRPAWIIPIPWTLMRLFARVAQYLPTSALEPDTLTMLQANNIADVSDFAAALGRTPRDVQTFIEA